MIARVFVVCLPTLLLPMSARGGTDLCVAGLEMEPSIAPSTMEELPVAAPPFRCAEQFAEPTCREAFAAAMSSSSSHWFADVALVCRASYCPRLKGDGGSLCKMDLEADVQPAPLWAAWDVFRRAVWKLELPKERRESFEAALKRAKSGPAQPAQLQERFARIIMPRDPLSMPKAPHQLWVRAEGPNRVELMMVLDGEQRGVRARLEADRVEPDFRALLVVATAHARAHAGAWAVVTPEGVDARPVIKTLKENGFPAKLEVVRLAEPSDDAQKR